MFELECMPCPSNAWEDIFKCENSGFNIIHYLLLSILYYGGKGWTRDDYYTWLPWWLRQYRIYLSCRRPGFSPWIGKIPWRREWQPTPVFVPGEFHGQRILAGYSPWGHKELDMPERLTHTLIVILTITVLEENRMRSWLLNLLIPGQTHCRASLNSAKVNLLLRF